MVTSSTPSLLVLDASTSFSGTIGGFYPGRADQIDLRDIAFGSTKKSQLSFEAASGTLDVTDGVYIAHLRLLDAVAGEFAASQRWLRRHPHHLRAVDDDLDRGVMVTATQSQRGDVLTAEGDRRACGTGAHIVKGLNGFVPSTHGPADLFSSAGSSLGRRWSRSVRVIDPDRNNIAAAQLAIDSKVEQCEVTHPPFDLPLCPSGSIGAAVSARPAFLCSREAPRRIC